MRYFITLTALLVCAALAPAADDQALKTFVADNCVRCHGDKIQKGGLNLASLPTDLNDAKVFRRWVKVHDRVSAGEMPPRSKLEAKETAPFLGALSQQIVAAEKAR
ncbi:MAG: c-type cytochrome domain-containing protein, partial [Gemmataceae bacterium]